MKVSQRRFLNLEPLEFRHLLTSFQASLLKDLRTGSPNSSFSNFKPLEDGQLLFNVGNAAWISDGSTDGTIRLDGFAPLTEDLTFWLHEGFEPFQSRGETFFSVGQDGHIWRTDGTSDGTHLVYDKTMPSRVPKAGKVVASVDAFDVLQISDQLWLFDGQNDPWLLESLHPFVESVATLNNQAFFLGRDEAGNAWLYETEGTASSTRPLFQVPSGATSLRAYRDQLLFFERENTIFLNQNLWSSDGTIEGTMELTEKPISGWAVSAFLRETADWLVEIDDVLLFGHPSATYRTDGTLDGTQLLHPGQYIGEIDGTHYIANGSSVLTTDGTTLRELSGKIFVPMEPELPPPPIYVSYELMNDSVLRVFHNSFYGTGWSALKGSTFVEFANNSEPDRPPSNVVSSQITQVGETWYGVDRYNDLRAERNSAKASSHLRSQHGTILNVTQEFAAADLHSEAFENSVSSIKPIEFMSGTNKFPAAPAYYTFDRFVWALDGSQTPTQIVEFKNPVFSSTRDFLAQNEQGNFLILDKGEPGADASDILYSVGSTADSLTEIALGDAIVHSVVPFPVGPKGSQRTLLIAETEEFGRELWIIEAVDEFLAGDIDQDHDVDFIDFLTLSTNFGKTDAAREEGDINGDGNIDFHDFLLLSTNYG